MDFFPLCAGHPVAPSSPHTMHTSLWPPCPLLGGTCNPQDQPATTAENLVGTNPKLRTHKAVPEHPRNKEGHVHFTHSETREEKQPQGHTPPPFAARARLSGPAQLPNRNVPDSNCNQFVTTAISPTVAPRGKHVKTNTLTLQARQKAKVGTKGRS